MAQQQNKKINLSSAKTGMVKDTHPSQLTDAQYTHALNANIESESGDSFNLTNEKSNILASRFKAGFKVIGFENDIDSNSTFFLLVNPSTGVGEFGVIEDNQNTNDVSDVLVDCKDCNKANQLAEPLETLVQLPLQTYTTLLTDADGYLDPNTNICMPFVKGSGFNFSIDHPIKKIVIKNEKCGKNIYFSDDYNVPRHINITDLLNGKYHDQNIPCDSNVTTACINYDELRIFKLFNIPKIEPATIELGGRLRMGMYEFLIAYSDAAGNEISPYYSITNPIAIFDKNNRILEQQNLADRTNLAIRLVVSNLDKKYSHYKVAVIQTADIEGASRYFIEGIHTINDNTVVYTTEQNKVATSFDKLLIDQLNVERSEGLTASNNILFQYGITQKKEINLQPVMNLLGEFMQWQTHIAPENLYENGVLSSKFLGYNRDEVVPLSIRFLLDGGYETSIFPLISRKILLFEDELVVNEAGVGINNDVESIIKNKQECNTVNRNKRWQFYNTAFLDDSTVCEGNDSIETVVVTEPITKTCIVEAIETVASGTISIELDNEDYIDLAQYIEDNKGNCPSEFIGTDICAALSADYSSVECALDPFLDMDCTDITTQSEIVVGDISNEVTEKIEKLFPTNYTVARAPKNCNVYPNNDSTQPVQDPSNPLGYQPGQQDQPLAVYVRESDFENEDCAYATDIVNYTNTSDNLNLGAFNNYYVAASQNLLLSSKNPTASGVSGNFLNKIHKGGVWFKGDTEGKNKFILDISKQKATTHTDDLNSGSQVRVSIFKSCSDSTAIYSKIVDLSSGEMLLFEKDTAVSTTLKIKDSSGVVTPIANGWPSNKKYYVVVDAPITTRTIDTDPDFIITTSETVYVVTPTKGCYTVTKRDIEFSRIDVSWDSIRIDKKLIYQATCNFNQPIVQSCKAIPFKKGNFAYWESEETYPDNPELYDSRSLSIPQNFIPVDLRSRFEDSFVQGIANGKYILNNNANFTCANIRHFKFPDNHLVPFMSSAQQSPFGSSIIYPLGITINEELINSFLDIAVFNGLLTQEDRNKISGYEIFRGDISLDRSVVASGLLYDMRKYKENSKTVYYPNYPFNSYQNDVLNLDEDLSTENGVTFGQSNRNYTFHSPETDYYRQGLPSELSIQGYMFGNSRGHFDEVQGHPKWVILSDKARNLADVLAGLQVTAEAVIKTAEIAAAGSGSYAFGWWAFGGLANGGGATQNIGGGIIATAATVAAAILETATAIVFKFGQYRYQWLKIFRDFGSPHNFAYYYYADGYYNYIQNSQEIGNKIRGLHVTKYLKDGRFVTTNEVTGERLNINNIDRENSVLISFGDMPISYPNSGYKTYDKGSDASITYQSQAGFDTVGRSPEVVKNIASPYAAIKNYLPTQYGTISSIKWLSTGFRGDLRNASTGCLSIFGGDTYISRHTLKRKMPLFLVTAMKQADLTPYNYFFYSNIGKNPKFYCSYEQNKDFSSGGKAFPDIVSDYVFDNLADSGNYIVPPSKFYLYYYGITNFLAETRINTNYRYGGKELNRNFYPLVGDLGAWTQEESVSIREPNVFLYNTEYSKQISLTRRRTLSDTYERAFNECTQDMPNGIIASLPDSTENSLYDPWLIYRPLDTFEFPSNYGKLKDIIDIEGQAILARFANTAVLYNKVDSKVDDGSNPTLSLLGGNSFFQRRSTSFHNTKLGYGGTQNATFVSNEFGHFYADAQRGQVLMVPSNGEGMLEISSMAGDKQSGMRNWFKEHLPFKILNHLPNVDIDNPYNGIGLTMGWDSRYRRVFLTKKDYIPKNDCIQYIEGQGFVIDDTVCNGELATISCPEGYTLIGNVCQRNSESVNLCPDGWEYDANSRTCVLVETVEAECVCAANVGVSPQTICSGDTTSIALTSTESGVSFSWTASSSGVTGASSGSGLAIAQTLLGAGTVTYTVTPFEVVSGCQGLPVQVVVTVQAEPNIIVTPTSPQSITSGDTTSIAISSSLPGTTFSWTVSQTTGITGASAGTGTSIADTISATEAGSATYTILATTPNGCTNTTTFTVEVSPPITACLNSFMIDVDTIDSGCSGHGCSHATFKLIANGVDLGFAYLSNAGGPSDMGDAGSVPNLNINPDTGTPGSSGSRYNRFILSPAQVTALTATTTTGDVTFSLSCDQTTGWNNYGGVTGACHTSAANMKIYVGGSTTPIYNTCPNGNSITINVCTGQLV